MTTRIGNYEFDPDPSNCLGSGTYAKVYKGYNITTKEPVAVKVVEFDSRNDTDKHYLSQEVRLMKDICHPNVIRMYERQKIGSCIYLVLEYCQGGDMKKFLESSNDKRIDEDTARHFMCQVAAGLKYLHERGIIHRDLKPHNLLLTSKSRTASVKICDFGFARMVHSEMNSVLGSPLYMAPEILRGQTYTSKSDLWSVGCIFHEMLVGKSPLNPRDLRHLRQLAGDLDTPFLSLPSFVSESCKDLLKGLLQKRDERRLSWVQFFNHPYLLPQNLTRSTIVRESDSKEQLKDNPSPLPSGNAWLQHIYCFDYHGRELTLYLQPTHRVAILNDTIEQVLNIPSKQQLLLTNEGIALSPSNILSDYEFHKKDMPMYLVNKALFYSSIDNEKDGSSNDAVLKQKYNFLALPNSIHTLPLPPNNASNIDHNKNGNAIGSSSNSTSNSNGNTNDMNGLLDINAHYSKKQENGQLLLENGRSLFHGLSLCISQKEHQVRVYKVVRTYLVNLSREVFTATQSLMEGFAEQKELYIKILDNVDNAIQELQSRKIPNEFLINNNTNTTTNNSTTLLDIFGTTSSIKEEILTLQSEYTRMEDNISKYDETVKNIEFGTNACMRKKLDTTPEQTMVNAINTASTHLSKIKSLVAQFSHRLKRTSQAVFEAKRTNDITKATVILKSGDFTELEQLWVGIEEEMAQLQLCEGKCGDAKDIYSELMMNVFIEVGRILKHIDECKATLSLLAPKQSDLQIMLSTLYQYITAPAVYDACVYETQRQSLFRPQLQQQIHTINHHLQERLHQETLLRTTFLESNTSHPILKRLFPFLYPLTVTDVNGNGSSDNDHKNNSNFFPVVSYALPQFDHTIPVLSQPLSDVEDDFSLLFDEQSDPTNQLKLLEKERAALIHRIEQMRIERQREHDMPALSAHQRVKELERENRKLRENDMEIQQLRKKLTTCQNNLTHERTLQQERIDSLTEEVDLLKRLTSTPSQRTRGSAGMKKQLEEMEKNATKALDLALRLLNDQHLQTLQEMGFSHNCAQKALLATGSKDVEAAMNWLFEQGSVADLDAPLTPAFISTLK